MSLLLVLSAVCPHATELCDMTDKKSDHQQHPSMRSHASQAYFGRCQRLVGTTRALRLHAGCLGRPRALEG